MRPDDQTYFEQRAEQQVALAQQSTDSRVVQAHYALATAYLDRVFEDGGAGQEGGLSAP